MPATEMIPLVAIIGSIVLAFIAVLRLITTMITHKTIRQSVQSNPELAAGLLNRIISPGREHSGDDRLGLILVAIGVAMAAGTLIAVDDPGIIRFAIAAALFPLLVGGTLWLRFRAAERAKQRDGEE